MSDLSFVYRSNQIETGPVPWSIPAAENTGAIKTIRNLVADAREIGLVDETLFDARGRPMQGEAITALLENADTGEVWQVPPVAWARVRPRLNTRLHIVVGLKGGGGGGKKSGAQIVLALALAVASYGVPLKTVPKAAQVQQLCDLGCDIDTRFP